MKNIFFFQDNGMIYVIFLFFQMSSFFIVLTILMPEYLEE